MSTEAFWGLQPEEGPPVELETYWLYYNGRSIYSVRMPPGTSDHDVRARAVAQHDRVPLCFPEPPVLLAQKLRFAEVRQFNDGPVVAQTGSEGQELEAERPRMRG